MGGEEGVGVGGLDEESFLQLSNTTIFTINVAKTLDKYSDNRIIAASGVVSFGRRNEADVNAVGFAEYCEIFGEMNAICGSSSR